MESVTPEKFLGQIFGPIGQKRDAKKIFLPRELDGMTQQHRAVSVALVLFVNDQVLEQNDKAAFGGADGEKQIDHADDYAVTPEHEHPSAARLFKNQSQPAELLVLVRTKIAFLGEEFAQHLGQLVQIRLGCRLNDDFLAHRDCAYSQKSSGLATRESGSPFAPE